MRIRGSLPDLPSKLITLAIDDLERAEETEGYTIRMSIWHSLSHEDAKCSICLAGAVMAMTLKTPITQYVSTPYGSFSEETTLKLVALDDFRNGFIESGFRAMGINGLEGSQFQRSIPKYLAGDNLFKDAMRQLSRDLYEEGL